VCVCEGIGASSMLSLIRRAGGLDEDVDNLTFELGVERSAAETEPVLVMLCLLNS
jgi:hypothetical protein